MDTLNLGMSDDGMVPLNAYIPPPETLVPTKEDKTLGPDIPNMSPPPPVDAKFEEKNINKQQIQMDATPISDIVDSYGSGGTPGTSLMEPPAPSVDPRMQGLQNVAPQNPPAFGATPTNETPNPPPNKNPFNLTDDQMEALLVGICAAIAISKPVQEKLSSSVPRFMNDMGGRSAVGLAATGMVATVVYFILQRYVFKK
jgi:hypothetical protein